MKKTDIVQALRNLGIETGDHVILHSSLSSIGHVDGGAEAVVDAFLATLGETGTLIVPTFGDLGVITKTVENRPEAVRSVHPLASVAAIGGQADEICRDHWRAPTAHGADTPYARLCDLDGYVCLLGVDHDRNTMLHSVEALRELPYLTETETHSFDTPEGRQSKSWRYFPGPHRDFIGLDRMLTESGKQTIGLLGKAVVRLIKARDLVNLCMEVGREDPAFALCDNPRCADCVAQRADIRRDQFRRESHVVVASSALAGRYVPEMIENLRAVGVDAVEIDYIQGRSVAGMSADYLIQVRDEFAAGGIEVYSVRLNMLADPLREILRVVARVGIGRLVMPLSENAAVHARLAGEENIAVSFCNVIHDSRAVARIFLDLKRRGVAAGFTFNAANFARAGEKPFLESFKTKARRFMDGLDIEDASNDGPPTMLARGNAEIKELVSILRCSGFTGAMTLGAGNRQVADLRATCAEFQAMIDDVGNTAAKRRK